MRAIAFSLLAIASAHADESQTWYSADGEALGSPATPIASGEIISGPQRKTKVPETSQLGPSVSAAMSYFTGPRLYRCSWSPSYRGFTYRYRPFSWRSYRPYRWHFRSGGQIRYTGRNWTINYRF